jgi:hypothetical protein
MRTRCARPGVCVCVLCLCVVCVCCVCVCVLCLCVCVCARTSLLRPAACLPRSRGQNEYGNNIAGPLPRSWMRAQWTLQTQILARYRSLGIVAQLPGFQGNVPAALATLEGDANITIAGGTGWMNSVDPLFGRIADAWMAQIIADFGTDTMFGSPLNFWQMDGYFDGGMRATRGVVWCAAGLTFRGVLCVCMVV